MQPSAAMVKCGVVLIETLLVAMLYHLHAGIYSGHRICWGKRRL